MKHLTLTPPARTSIQTDIFVGRSLAGAVAKHVPGAIKADKIVVLFDDAVQHIASLVGKGLKNPILIEVPSGDASKSLAQVEKITASLLAGGCTRNTLLVCVGGGMLTDLGGFVASVFMRGIPCVYVPTSLLAMVDASVGGKTAVNSAGRKNMLGSLTHPLAVIADMDLLSTLPDEALFDGLTEVVKIGAIADADLFKWMEKNMNAIKGRDMDILEECVARAIQSKAHIVETDESDTVERLLLNFGHTVGHAVESDSGYRISHGRAVSIGMVAEMKLAKFADFSRVLTLLTALGMPLAIPASCSADVLWQSMLVDKKSTGGEVRIAVPVTIGTGAVRTVSLAEFKTLFP